MLMPSIFGENLFDDFFEDFPWMDDNMDMKKTEKKLYGRRAARLMKTDIKEQDNGYELVIDLPGFKKDEVSASLENGYLTISAAKGLDEEDKDKKSGKYIRKERYSGSCTRTFYVGDSVKQDDIKAKFEDGTLKLTIPKETAKPAVEEKKYVSIEG